jgi:DNA ligase D
LISEPLGEFGRTEKVGEQQRDECAFRHFDPLAGAPYPADQPALTGETTHSGLHSEGRRRDCGKNRTMPSSAEKVLDVGGRAVRVTHPDKVYFSERGETKLDLINFYLAIAEPLLCTVQGRPVLLQRFRDGADGPGFFQKRIPDTAPDWLETTTVETVNGTPSRALVIGDIAHVVWAANLGSLGFHVWPYLADDPEHTDELRLDLDPQPGTDFTHVRAAAKELKKLLDEVGVVGYPKTTGNRGLHVYVRLEPRWDSYEVRSAAVAIARELERRSPDLITAQWWKEDRGERIFLDFNQNAPHKTVFGAWSVRARKGAQVSTPIGWDDIDAVHPDELTMVTVPERLKSGGDPWADMNANPQTLEPFLEMNARDRESGLMDAPWPPVYPKQPDEPPRVSRSRAKKD